MRKQPIALLLLLIMLCVCGSAALAASRPEVITQPQSQTVVEGGSCTFTASALNKTAATWRLQSPDGSQDFPFTDAPERFSGLKVAGKNGDRLRLSNIPGEMDGWLVYCRYASKGGKTDTRKVTLTVTDKSGQRLSAAAASAAPAVTPAPDGAGSEVLFAPAEGEKILRTVGCVMHFIDKDGNSKGSSFTELNFGEAYYNTHTRETVTDGSVDVRVSAEIPQGKKVACWIINGAKYTFNKEVKSFTLREVPYGMTIEAVLSGEAPRTLPSPDQIQQQRSGNQLLVETQSARMHHLNSQRKSAGGMFTEFDFTNDYVNKATGQTETGGRVTVDVAAAIPDGKLVTYWRFNGARLNFNSDISSFVVENLTSSMLYQPVFHVKTTPVPEYSISCKNCVFSGGGYTNAKSGTVPYGTTITITPQGNSWLGWWSGSYNSGEVSKKSITRTVKSNCSFEWHMVIN